MNRVTIELSPQAVELGLKLIAALEHQADALDSISVNIPDAADVNQPGVEIAAAIGDIAKSIDQIELNR